jgi:UDP-GlcNAc3NAcA epimerase
LLTSIVDAVKIISVVGARPQFVKIAPMAHALQRRGRGGTEIEHIILHTGQHYDAGMSDVFFSELELPRAQFNLGVGSGRHGSQTGAMLAQIEEVLLEVNPDLLIVYGDTNSTVAGALAGTKLHIPVAHVEAGLRSFNRRMPEEINRIATDHICDLLLAPTPAAMKNLAAEALAPRSVFTGDIMYDAVLFYRQLALERSQVRQRLGLESGGYAIVTMHRAENTDDLTRLRSLLDVFNEIAAGGLALVFPVHPRTAQRIRSHLAEWKPHPGLQLVAPVGYLDMLWLTDHASMALTDSGGLQKEAFFLGCPCVTLRGETEWVETVEAGGNIVVGTDPAAIRAAVERWQRYRRRDDGDFSQTVGKYFGNGDAADRIINVLHQFLERKTAERSVPSRTSTTQGDALAGRLLSTVKG